MSQQPWNGPQPGPGGQPQFGPGGQPQFGAVPGGPSGQPPFGPGGQPPQFGQSPQYGAPQGGQPPQFGQSPQYGAAPGGPTTSSGPAGPGGPGMPPGATKKSAAPKIVAAVAAAGVLAGGAYLAYDFLTGSPASAATAGIPKEAFAVVEVPLNPAKADQLALKGILDKYPDLATSETQDYKKALYEALTKQSGDSDIPDYDTEVKPWLGDSISAGVLGDANDPLTVISLSVTDEAKAKSFAEKEFESTSEEFEYVVRDGLLIVHDARVTAEMLDGPSLTEHPEYQEDMKAIGDGSLATMWVGSGAAGSLLEQAGKIEGTEVDTEQIEQLKQMHGAAALKAETDLLKVDFSFFTGTDAGTLPDVQGSVGALPADAMFAFGSGANAESYVAAWKMLEQTPEFGQVFQQFGISSGQDLYAVLGEELVAAFGGLDQSTGMPRLGIKLKPGDMARHQEALSDVVEPLMQQGLEQKIDGDTAIYAMGYSPDEITSGSLKDNEAYKRVASGKAHQIMFLDLNKFAEMVSGGTLPQEAQDSIGPIQGIGLIGNVEGQRSVGTLKIAFK